MISRRIRMAALALSALALGACATTAAGPAASVDKQALAEEVFTLSGGMGELRLAARYALPMALSGVGDVGARCRESLGKDAPGMARALCDMAQAAIGDAENAGGAIGKALERELARFEGRAAAAMAETYSVAELQAMARYYASPEGRSIVEKRAQFWAALSGREAAP